jgi:hypothetical protein
LTTKRLDVRKDVSGCFAGELSDPSTSESTAIGGRISLLHATASRTGYYLLLRAWAPSNCNILGMCGMNPTGDTTLLWLDVAADLSVRRKQAEVVEDCRHEVVDPREGETEGRAVGDEGGHRFRLRNGRLRIESVDHGSETSRRVSYRSDQAARGIQVGHPVPTNDEP